MGTRLKETGVTLVRQQDKFGCVVACLATVLCESYEAVRADIGEKFVKEGCDHFVWHAYLARRGFAVQQFWVHDCLLDSRRDPWPMEPWADVHLCTVDDQGPCYHLVVLLRDGTVLDPATDEVGRLADYLEVVSMCAVVPVG